MTRIAAPRALGLVVGFVADRLLGDPERFHPVAGFGSAATVLESRVYADSRARGAGYALALVGSVAALGAVAERAARHPISRVAVTAAATWVVLGGRSLEREAEAVHAHVGAGDLVAARQRLTHLVGRSTDGLDEGEIARAVVESVAENTSDAVVAPLVWGAMLGIPGLLGYRAVNTLDAMVGHRSARYARFGWAAARLDDLLGLPGSRLCGVLTLLAEPGRAGDAWRAWRQDAAAHPSPNAGVVEAVFAGALGIRLGGTNRYGTRVERRSVLGDGRSPEPSDVIRATALARRVGLGAAAVTVALIWVAARGRPRRR